MTNTPIIVVSDRKKPSVFRVPVVDLSRHKIRALTETNEEAVPLLEWMKETNISNVLWAIHRHQPLVTTNLVFTIAGCRAAQRMLPGIPDDKQELCQNAINLCREHAVIEAKLFINQSSFDERLRSYWTEKEKVSAFSKSSESAYQFASGKAFGREDPTISKIRDLAVRSRIFSTLLEIVGLFSYNAFSEKADELLTFAESLMGTAAAICMTEQEESQKQRADLLELVQYDALAQEITASHIQVVSVRAADRKN